MCVLASPSSFEDTQAGSTSWRILKALSIVTELESGNMYTRQARPLLNKHVVYEVGSWIKGADQLELLESPAVVTEPAAGVLDAFQ